MYFILVGDGGECRTSEKAARGVAWLTFIDPLDDNDYRLELVAADVLIVSEKQGVASMGVPSKLA